MTTDIKAFQARLYDDIPAVKFMQLQLKQLSDTALTASAPLQPNINDKGTVFGGSSGAIMTVCGWSFIKLHLERHHIENDVVIHHAKTIWNKAQSDDLTINIQIVNEINWTDLCQQLQNTNALEKINLICQVLNQQGVVCCEMTANYVILKRQSLLCD